MFISRDVLRYIMHVQIYISASSSTQRKNYSNILSTCFSSKIFVQIKKIVTATEQCHNTWPTYYISTRSYDRCWYYMYI